MLNAKRFCPIIGPRHYFRHLKGMSGAKLYFLYLHSALSVKRSALSCICIRFQPLALGL
jgi:hypothetical protein